jgi:hypothetical protein
MLACRSRRLKSSFSMRHLNQWLNPSTHHNTYSPPTPPTMVWLPRSIANALIKRIQMLMMLPPQVSPPFSRNSPLELVIFCGSPGAGKSTFYWNYLEPLGYERVNQDILKSVRPPYLAHAIKLHQANE